MQLDERTSMLTVADGKLTAYDAGDWSYKRFSALREHHEIEIEYWSFNREDERPKDPKEIYLVTFKATSDWISVGLQSKVIYGNVFVGDRPIRAHLSITQKRATLAVYR